jgi:hypothetical protein
MKSLKLIIFILFTTLSVWGQGIQQAGTYPVYQTDTYTEWQLSNPGGYGVASFYWKTTRSQSKNYYGQYNFDIWFYSNSYYRTGGLASTYVWGIYVNSDGKYTNRTPSWILFRDVSTNQVINFSSFNPNPIIILSWQGLSIF